MRPTTALAPLAPLLTGVPAAVAGALPVWALIALLGVSALLAVAQVVTTQIIRLRASNRITRSSHNLRVLEIEDLPHHRRPPTHPGPAPARTRRHRRPAAQRRTTPNEPAEDPPPQ
jgi:hypothetical protein